MVRRSLDCGSKNFGEAFYPAWTKRCLARSFNRKLPILMTRESSAMTQRAPASPVHILTVDVEDYFMVEAFSGTVSRSSWDDWPSRVVSNTQRAIDLFDKYGVRGTFFFVGWVAAKFPQLVRDVHTRGHELACHSYWHRTVYSLSPEEFRR